MPRIEDYEMDNGEYDTESYYQDVDDYFAEGEGN